SKCVHIAGVGLVSLPCANVSAASRKLKSSWPYGCGMGESGRRSKRRVQGVAPARKTQSARLRASFPNEISSRENNPEAARGKHSARATVIRVNPMSMAINDGPAEVECDASILGNQLHSGAH